MDKLKEILRKELSGWGKVERYLFPLVLLLIVIISVIKKDNVLAILSAVFGLGYTILAGKGKIGGFYVGLVGSLCYSYISYKNQLYGNLVLYLCYYFPMYMVGIYKWSKNLKPESHDIVKISIPKQEFIMYLVITTILTVLCTYILYLLHDQSSLIDAITTMFSVLGMYLSIKRSMEQWYIWMLVNILSTVMWIQAYLNGSNCFATILMWLVYVFLSFYFLHNWKKAVSTK